MASLVALRRTEKDEVHDDRDSQGHGPDQQPGCPRHSVTPPVRPSEQEGCHHAVPVG